MSVNRTAGRFTAPYTQREAAFAKRPVAAPVSIPFGPGLLRVFNGARTRHLLLWSRPVCNVL